MWIHYSGHKFTEFTFTKQLLKQYNQNDVDLFFREKSEYF